MEDSIELELGIVAKSTGSWYDVKLDEGGRVLPCRMAGRFRQEDKRLTNPVAVGDRVKVVREADQETGVIQEILERSNQVLRQSPRKKHQVHMLASNVDQAVLIMTIVHPKLKQGFIDRFLLMLEPYNIPGLIVFNKADVYEEGDLNVYAYLQSIYEAIGYKVLLTSAVNGRGLKDLKAALKDKVSLLSGQSGVGKSTLINAIQPQLEIRTQDLSDYSGKGQHTTTFAEMYPLDFGGYVIDAPGIKTLSFNYLSPLDIAHNFREIFEVSKDCKFGSRCLHRSEPGCAVKKAVESEMISELRYFNYLDILDEAEAQNSWEQAR